MRIPAVIGWVLVVAWAIVIIGVWIGGRRYGAIALLLTIASLAIALRKHLKHRSTAR
jgi:hypothetical protein